MLKPHPKSPGEFLLDNKCPHCNYKMDSVGAAYEYGAMPRENDASLCINCGLFSIFTETLRLRKATDEELHEILSNSQNLQLLRSWERVKGRKR